MASIEQATRHVAARPEQAPVAQPRLHGGARWIASFRGDAGHDSSSLKPEHLARGELYYNSTCCWV